MQLQHTLQLKLRRQMTKSQKISEMILIELAATGSMRQAFDKVMGQGAYDKLAMEIYYELRAKQSK